MGIENNLISIEADKICKTFNDSKKGRIHALSDISFTCAKGEITGIVGPNGAGKTTLLRIISSLIAPTEGKISILGMDNREYGEINKQNIGFLSGDTALYERLTGEEILYFSAELYGMKKDNIKKRIEELSDILKFENIGKRICKNLSTGEKQKISIARAMIHDPEILILDEATNGLDILARKHILWLVKTAKEKGKTVLYSAHNMEEIEKISDKILFIHSGKIVEQGTMEEILLRHNQKDLTECFLDIINKA